MIRVLQVSGLLVLAFIAFVVYYYEGGRWEISKNKLGEVEHRLLTPPEAEALGELREKRANFVTLKVWKKEEPGSLMKKVMAGIPARTSCLADELPRMS